MYVMKYLVSCLVIFSFTNQEHFVNYILVSLRAHVEIFNKGRNWPVMALRLAMYTPKPQLSSPPLQGYNCLKEWWPGLTDGYPAGPPSKKSILANTQFEALCLKTSQKYASLTKHVFAVWLAFCKFRLRTHSVFIQTKVTFLLQQQLQGTLRQLGTQKACGFLIPV